MLTIAVSNLGPATAPEVRAATDSSPGSLLANTARVVNIRGDVDLATAPMWRALLLQSLEQGAAPVVVDLSEVRFMDSNGVHLLMDAHQRLEAQNRQLAIVCPEHGQIRRLLALVGLLGVLTVRGSRDGALRAVVHTS